jgi:hypothetical protein
MLTQPGLTSPGVAPSGSHPLRRLWNFAQADHRAVIVGTVLSVLNKFFDVLPELLIGVAVDVVVRGNQSLVSDWFGIEDRWSQLLLLAGVTVVIWVFESITDYASSIVWRNLAQSVEHTARSDLYRHLQTLELAWFEDRSSGGLLSVVNDDVNQLERFLDVGASEVIRTATNVVLVGAFFFIVSPTLALVAFLPIPLIIAGSLRYQRRLEPHYAAVRDSVGDLSTTLTNNLGGIATSGRSSPRSGRPAGSTASARTATPTVGRSRCPLRSFLSFAWRSWRRSPSRCSSRPGGDRGRLGGRAVLDPGVHDPAIVVAAHRMGEVMDLTSGRPPRSSASSTCWRCNPASARSSGAGRCAWRRALRPGELRLRRNRGGTG